MNKSSLIKGKGKIIGGITLVFFLILAGVGFAVSNPAPAFGQTTEPTAKLSISNASKNRYGVAGLAVKGSQSKKNHSRCAFSKNKSSCQYNVAAGKEITLAAIPKNKSDKTVWTGCDKTFSMKRSARDRILPGRTIYGCKTTSPSSGEKKLTVKFGS